jgi:hypothetical protein
MWHYSASVTMFPALPSLHHGEPLPILLVKQALRESLRTAEQCTAFVSKLRGGTVAFDDDVNQGRSRSLDASLQYGFEAAFNADEHRTRNTPQSVSDHGVCAFEALRATQRGDALCSS